MDSMPKSEATVSHDKRLSIIKRDQARRFGSQPLWYHVACSAMPLFAHQAQELYVEQRRTQAESEKKDQMTPTPLQSWSQVEADLHQRLPDEFTTLKKLQEHVEFWTNCDEEKITKLFGGLHTEQERLNAILGSGITLPKEPTSLDEQSHHPQAAEQNLGSWDTDSDESLTIELEKPPKRRKRAKAKQGAVEAKPQAGTDTVSEIMVDTDPTLKEDQQLVMQPEDLCNKETRKRPRKRRTKRKQASDETEPELKSEGSTVIGTDS